MKYLGVVMIAACSSGLEGPDAFSPSAAYVLPITGDGSSRVLLADDEVPSEGCTTEWEGSMREYYASARARIKAGEGCEMLSEPRPLAVSRGFGGNPEIELGVFDDGRAVGSLIVCGEAALAGASLPWAMVPYYGTVELKPTEPGHVQVMLDLAFPAAPAEPQAVLRGSLDAVLCPAVERIEFEGPP